MNLYWVIVLFLLFMSCKDNSSNNNQLIEDLPIEILDAQVELVSVLTGHQSLGKTNNTIKSRATQKERLLTRLYMSEVITQLNLEPKVHNYRAANSNPFIDFLLNPLKGTNLYTVVPSTSNSQEYVLLGAHYDTARNCPGANDNAAAMALLYGVTKKLINEPVRHKNVMVVYFDQEEEVLVGSRAFAKFLKKNNFNIHSVHTFDQIGWDKDLDKAIEIELPSKALEEIYQTQAEKLNIPIHKTKVNSTDHQSFRELGYEAIGVTEEYVNGDTTPFKDTPNDTFETVNFDFLASTTTLVFGVVQHIISKN